MGGGVKKNVIRVGMERILGFTRIQFYQHTFQKKNPVVELNFFCLSKH